MDNARRHADVNTKSKKKPKGFIVRKAKPAQVRRMPGSIHHLTVLG